VTTLNIAEIIKKLRRAEKKMKEMEAEYEAAIEPYKEMSEAGRAVLLKYLNDTGQRSAATVEGGCNKRTKVTYQVRDREDFKKHVIGSQSWEMIVWRANDAVCEDYVQAHKETPPGTYRNAIDILTITAPVKPKLRKMKPASVTEAEWATIEESATLESNNVESGK
jgi:hypothetical protein